MSWTEVANSVGGIGGIIAGLSAWLGTFYMYRTLQKEKTSRDKQLELLRTSLESIKEHNVKYTSAQFESYNSLWSALIDLKIHADKLWEEVNYDNLIALNKSLYKASELIQKSRIFLEEQHYQQFLEIERVFNEYRIGKKQLFTIRSEEDLQDKSIPQLKKEIRQIEINSFFRNSYTHLLDQVADSLKEQLGLKEADSATRI